MISATEEYWYSYDNAERLTTVKHSINNMPQVTLASNTYDSQGHLLTKKLGGNLDATSYAYNLRGWLTDIDGPRFNQHLYYNSCPL